MDDPQMRTPFNLPLIYRHRTPSLWRQFGFAIFVFGVSLANVTGWCSRTEADDEDDAEVAVVPAAGQCVLTEQQFDQMAFSGGRQEQVVRIVNGVRQVEFTSQSNSESAFRDRIGAAITAEIQTIDERVSLAEAQKKKLRLASRVDVAQHISRLAELRTKLTSKPLDRQQYVELMQELQPLRTSSSLGVLGEMSLFQKTLRHTLTPEQFTRYRRLERERQAKMIDGVLINLAATANIEWALADDTNTSISERRQVNRKRFIDELLTHGELPRTQNAYLQYIVLLEIGRLENQLKPLVSEESWKKLQAQVVDARRLEPALRKSKVWPVAHADDDEVADDKMKD
jgi:hypothetical protein